MRCNSCGREIWCVNRCPDCVTKWVDRRRIVFAQAISELGPLIRETKGEIMKRVKELEATP